MNDQAFTLMEIIIVIAILAILMAFGITLIGSAKNKQLIIDTKQRIQAITNNLQAQSGSQSTSYKLSKEIGIGPANTFTSLVNLKHIVGINKYGIDLNDNREQPAPITINKKFNVYGFRAHRGSKLYGLGGKGAGWQDREIQFEKEIIPPKEGPVPSDYYINNWHYNWPTTDWMTGGSHPPLLIHPWGMLPIQLNGQKVNPALPLTHETPFDIRKSTNRWVVVGPKYNGTIWSYDTSDGRGIIDIYKKETEGYRIGAVDQSVTYINSDGVNQTVATNTYFPFDLGHCSPIKSAQFLQAAGILPNGDRGLELYRQDRDSKKPWNDAWGNPLIVVYALYHAPRCALLQTDGKSLYDIEFKRHYWLEQAEKAYGFYRCLYIAIASGGDIIDPASKTWNESEDKDFLSNYWLDIRTKTQAWQWTAESWTADTPPWEHVRIVDDEDTDQIYLLSRPLMIP